MSRRSRNSAKPLTEAQRVIKAKREAKFQRFTVTLAYLIIALSVAGGFAMSFWPQAFGLHGANPAIGFGLAALAGFRLYALRSELRRQSAAAASPASSPAGSKRRARTSARRA